MKKLLLVIFTFLVASYTYAQQNVISQTVRGRVVEKETKSPIIGAVVIVSLDSGKTLGNQTDEEGNFEIEKVPVGKYSIRCKYVGYQEVLLSNVIVTSGKEVILNIEMEESISDLNEVIVIAIKKESVRNEMALVSSRGFDIEETERYAGSRQDPARMASNFAGAQGTNDTRNDIVIRGNSPIGVIWRMDDVNIPNPNHFAIAGTTGGPVSILNNKVIGNSDFITGAFPAEYGNGLAGVFDLRFRNGNNQKFEFTGQLGFLGTELAAEGPINKEKKSSFIFTYRYSTLKIFESFNIKIGTDAVPYYQDASFKLNFPIKKKSNFSIWGIGGDSRINIMVSNSNTPPTEIYGDKDRDQLFGSRMGTLATQFSHTINNSAYTKVTLSQSYQKNNATHMLAMRDSSYQLLRLQQSLGYRFIQNITGLNWFVNKKFSARTNLKAGVSSDWYQFDFVDSALLETQFKSNFYPTSGNFNIYNLNAAANFSLRWNSQTSAFLLQPYTQIKYRFSDNLAFNGGLHLQYFSLSNSISVEPRLGLRWNFKPDQTLSFGSGLHSQMIPTYIYFYNKPKTDFSTLEFKNTGFMRSFQTVAGYDKSFNQFLRIRTEIYYQYLYQIPVLVSPSSFSLINQGSGFSRFFPDTFMQNTGTGYNTGIEFTFEKFYSKGFFLLATASIFESRYKGSDGIERQTDFNGRFATNLLSGYEKSFGNQTYSIGGKLTYAGGRLYSPVDTAKTLERLEYVPVDAQRNTLRFDNYFRFDLKLGFKVNTKKFTHEIAVDLVNLFNIQNNLGLTYAPDPKNPLSLVRAETQLGFLPLFYYKIDFGLKSR